MKKENIRHLAVVLSAAVILGGLSLAAFFKPSEEYSFSERRKLQQFPEISMESLSSTKFMSEFESYSLDQFPLREQFRALKAVVGSKLLGQKDNNGLYLAEGHLSKMEYPLSENSVISAADKLTSFKEAYLDPAGCKSYFAVIPDKNYFLAEENGFLAMDYEKLLSIYKEGMEGVEYIHIWDQLSLQSYYNTDTHWRQELLLPVAETIAEGMGFSLSLDYEEKDAGSFQGVYFGQYPLSVEEDSISYLYHEMLDGCTAFHFETGETKPVYDFEKAADKDGYDLFLSGASALITVENPNAATNKELLLFRDSFGSSIAPLLLEQYAKVTLIDLRYITSDYLPELVEFDGQDVLFLYSTLILNNSTSLR